MKNFFKKSKEKFKKFPKTNFKKFIKKCLHFLQAYIVTGGYSDGLASTETLDKERGSAWKLVASLPSPRSSPRGLGVGNGQFLVAGQYIIYHKPVDSKYRIYEDSPRGAAFGFRSCHFFTFFGDFRHLS